MYVNSVIALSSCIPSAQAAGSRRSWSTTPMSWSTPDASTRKASARCHSPAFAHAAIRRTVERHEGVGSTPHARISSKISSAASTPAARDAAEIAELNETASHTAPLREWWVAGGEPRAPGAGGRRRRGGGRHLRCIWRKTATPTSSCRAARRRARATTSRRPTRRSTTGRAAAAAPGAYGHCNASYIVGDAPLPLALQVEQQRREVALDNVLAGEDLADVVGGRARRQPHQLLRQRVQPLLLPHPRLRPPGDRRRLYSYRHRTGRPGQTAGAARTAPRTAPRATGGGERREPRQQNGERGGPRRARRRKVSSGQSAAARGLRARPRRARVGESPRTRPRRGRNAHGPARRAAGLEHVVVDEQLGHPAAGQQRCVQQAVRKRLREQLEKDVPRNVERGGCNWMCRESARAERGVARSAARTVVAVSCTKSATSSPAPAPASDSRRPKLTARRRHAASDEVREPLRRRARVPVVRAEGHDPRSEPRNHRKSARSAAHAVRTAEASNIHIFDALRARAEYGAGRARATCESSSGGAKLAAGSLQPLCKKEIAPLSSTSCRAARRICPFVRESLR